MCVCGLRPVVRAAHPLLTQFAQVYVTLMDAVFEGLTRVTSDAKYASVIAMENFHRLHAQLSLFKVTRLAQRRAEAQELYRESMATYVRNILGRPMERLSRFFDAVQRKLESGTPDKDVGYQTSLSLQELKKCIAAYPAKEVKRGLEKIFRKVDQHLCAEENLTVVVRRSVHEEFIRLYNAFEGLIARCYADAGVHLEFTLDELMRIFDSISF